MLKGFLEINGNLRKKNNDTIAALAAKSQPKMLWTEAFAPMGNAQVESRFADRRTYFHDDKEIDKQVHLGFDLASLQRAPVHASNAGVVVYADYLGIYGNCVIVDHGLGVQSLYAHLSTIGVKVGDAVTKGQEDRPHRRHGISRRRSPALHDAAARHAGESRRMVGSALDARIACSGKSKKPGGQRLGR